MFLTLICKVSLFFYLFIHSWLGCKLSRGVLPEHKDLIALGDIAVFFNVCDIKLNWNVSWFKLELLCPSNKKINSCQVGHQRLPYQLYFYLWGSCLHSLFICLSECWMNESYLDVDPVNTLYQLNWQQFMYHSHIHLSDCKKRKKRNLNNWEENLECRCLHEASLNGLMSRKILWITCLLLSN